MRTARSISPRTDFSHSEPSSPCFFAYCEESHPHRLPVDHPLDRDRILQQPLRAVRPGRGRLQDLADLPIRDLFAADRREHGVVRHLPALADLPDRLHVDRGGSSPFSPPRRSSSSTLRTSRSAIACPAFADASDSDRLLSAPRIFFASSFSSESLILTREAISFRRSALIQTPFSFPERAVRNASVLSSPFARASCARSRPATRRSSPSFFFSDRQIRHRDHTAAGTEELPQFHDLHVVSVHRGHRLVFRVLRGASAAKSDRDRKDRRRRTESIIPHVTFSSRLRMKTPGDRTARVPTRLIRPLLSRCSGRRGRCRFGYAGAPAERNGAAGRAGVPPRRPPEPLRGRRRSRGRAAGADGGGRGGGTGRRRGGRGRFPRLLARFLEGLLLVLDLFQVLGDLLPLDLDFQLLLVDLLLRGLRLCSFPPRTPSSAARDRSSPFPRPSMPTRGSPSPRPSPCRSRPASSRSRPSTCRVGPSPGPPPGGIPAIRPFRSFALMSSTSRGERPDRAAAPPAAPPRCRSSPR